MCRSITDTEFERGTNYGTVVIIDGNSLINRAYYAMQRPMITKGGLYTQGVYGFLNMLNKIIKDYEPTHITVAFDLKAPTFRHLEYSEYKAGRKKMPPELAMQMPLLKEVLTAMNIKILELEGYEADDIIGTVAKKAETIGMSVLIITGDKDALQLASQNTRVLITKKGISEFEMFDDNKMMEVYGLTPQQFIDYKGLRGDTSDNIPGIPGVGEKTALKLLEEFKSVENLIENSHLISSAKMREKIEENAQLAIMSKRLATINTESPISFEFEELQYVEPNYNELINVYVKLEFNSLLKKLKNSSELKEATVEEVALDNTAAIFTTEKCEGYKIVESFDEIKNAINNSKVICIKIFSDDNHREIPQIMGLSLFAEKTAYFVKSEEKELLQNTIEYLINQQSRIIGHNLKEDYYALLSVFGLENHASSQGNIFNTYFDTAVAEYVLDPTKSNYQINTLALEYLHREIAPFEDFMADNSQIDMFADVSEQYAKYGMTWCDTVSSLMILQSNKLSEDKLFSVAETLEFPLVEVMAAMEKEGFKLDTKELTQIGTGIRARIEELTEEIYQLSGEEFNINSPQQLGVILFEKLELPAAKKTKKGYSTSAEVLEKLEKAHPIISLILEYRKLTKLNGTYIEGLLPLKGEDGKIHAHLQQTVTATGRISCTEPNLQNIPVKQELGKTIRKAFIPSTENHILIGADYSQIELRVLAHLSKEQHLIDAFNQDQDIHRLTAARVFNVPFEEVTPLQRSNAKAVNFGVIYGMSSFGLSEELNISRKEAEKYIADYFMTNSAVKTYMDEQIEFCKENGYVTTIMNRRRAIKEINASNFMVRNLGERLAMNTPIQGSAADIIKLAMISTYRSLNVSGLKARLILQVHDELILDVPAEEIEKAKEVLCNCMENAIKLDVKLTAEASTGDNWYLLK